MTVPAPTTPLRSSLGPLARRAARLMFTPHPTDSYQRSLALPGLTASGTADVVGVERRGDWTVLSLRTHPSFRLPAAGGAVQLGVVVNGVVHHRCYSPIDARTRQDGGFTVVVRRHAGGWVSDYLWQHAAVGDRFLLTSVDGEMTLPATRPADVLLVSGGSGLTPMLAIAATLAAERHTGRVAWLHFVRDTADLPVPERIAHLGSHPGVEVRVVVTSRDGHLTPDLLDEVAPWHADGEVFLCGPSPLAAGLAEVLGEEGFARVRREHFVPETPQLPTDDSVGGTVTHATSGIVAENTGTSLLEGAEAAGLNPAHGCRMGICHTCVAVRRCGATRDLTSGAVDDRPDTPIRICVSAPVGDVTLEL